MSIKLKILFVLNIILLFPCAKGLPDDYLNEVREGSDLLLASGYSKELLLSVEAVSGLGPNEALAAIRNSVLNPQERTILENDLVMLLYLSDSTAQDDVLDHLRLTRQGGDSNLAPQYFRDLAHERPQRSRIIGMKFITLVLGKTEGAINFDDVFLLTKELSKLGEMSPEELALLSSMSIALFETRDPIREVRASIEGFLNEDAGGFSKSERKEVLSYIEELALGVTESNEILSAAPKLFLLLREISISDMR